MYGFYALNLDDIDVLRELKMISPISKPEQLMKVQYINYMFQDINYDKSDLLRIKMIV